MLHNISLYPGLTEDQLCRFFPEKEATAKVLLAHMLKEGRIFCSGNGRYYANQEAQNGTDKDLSSASQMESCTKSCLSRKARKL